MKFVEIQTGQAINVDHIAFFQDFNGMTQVISMSGQTYTANIPYHSFREALEAGHNMVSRKLETISRQIGTPVP